MKYDPTSYADRKALAVAIVEALNADGFTKREVEGTNEDVFVKPIEHRGLHVVIYSTIENGACRAVRTDAIRVLLVYRRPADGDKRTLGKETRVHRTGEINEVVRRVRERVRNVEADAVAWEACRHCGAPLFTSKAGNKVCSDLCWTQ